MFHTDKLTSFHVIERQNRENIVTWTYPTLSEDNKKFLLQKCFSTSDDESFFSLRKNSVYYQIAQNFSENFAIVVLTADFDPEKYKILCNIFSITYSKCRNPVELVKLYLKLFTSGACASPAGQEVAFNLKDHESPLRLKDLIRSFQLEIIFLYNAILLKRRVLLFGSDLESAQRALFSVMHLVSCRRPNEYILPCVSSLKELKGLAFYAAATTNPSLAKNHKIFDIFVDLDAREVSVSPLAEEIMTMTKTHKEIATFLVKLSESELTDPEVCAQIARKTSEILDLLKNIGHNLKLITVNDLKAKNFHPNLENFIFHLALAENLMML